MCMHTFLYLHILLAVILDVIEINPWNITGVIGYIYCYWLREFILVYSHIVFIAIRSAVYLFCWFCNWSC